MDSAALEQPATTEAESGRWRRFIVLLVAVLTGLIGAAYLLVLLADPYDVVPFSLPLERRIVGFNQRYMYPQIVRSRKFDSFLVGTSTSRLIDPAVLGEGLGARLANLSTNAMSPWEQQAMVGYIFRHAGAPKTLIMGIDITWCHSLADRNRITHHGYPAWLYDDNPWNDYWYFLNSEAVKLAGRMVGYWLGINRERIRYDGFQVFTPPESAYDAAKAQGYIWPSGRREIPFGVPPPVLSESERAALSFPALNWLNDILERLPATCEVLIYLPLHVAYYPWPGSQEAAVAQECKARVAAMARKTGTKVIDYGIVSPITTNDSNYWDSQHYRLPIGYRIARELIPAILEGRPSADGSYRIVVP